MTNGRTTPIARRIAFTAAISLTLISAACCAIFGWQMGLHHSPLLALLMAGAALAAECLKPLAVVAVLEAARAWRLFSALLLCLLAAVLISYSVAAELSLASSVRDDNASKRQQATALQERAERRYKATESQLAALAGARPASELKPLIDSLRATKGARCDVAPGSADFGPISRRVCKQVSELEAEAARYSERVRLEGQLAAAAAVLNAGHTTKMTDPLAGSLAAYARALGWSTTEQQLIPWLNLLPVLLLELGSSLGLLLARSVGERQGVQPVLRADQKAAFDDPPSGGAKGRVVEILNENGGRIQSGQRGLAALIGVSAARVNQVLHELVDDGIVTVTSMGQRGTLVELAGA